MLCGLASSWYKRGLTWTPMRQSYSYDGARAHNNPGDPGANTEMEKLPAYSPFLNIVEQAISALKAAIKTDISRHEEQARMGHRDEAVARGIPLGEFRTQLLLEVFQRSIGTITPAKCTCKCRFMQTSLPRCMSRELR